MNKLRLWVTALLMVVSIGGGAAALTIPTPSFAACANAPFLSLPPWYRGLQDTNTCGIKSPTDFATKQDPSGVSVYVWKIVLNIIDIVLQLIGYLAVGFIIYGGFKYMLSAGDAAGLAKAKTTIMNAAIGLVISIAAVAIVNVITGLF